VGVGSGWNWCGRGARGICCCGCAIELAWPVLGGLWDAQLDEIDGVFLWWVALQCVIFTVHQLSNK
jgi:hypothetical protein